MRNSCKIAVGSLLMIACAFMPVAGQDARDMEMVGRAMYDGDLSYFNVLDDYLYVSTEKSNPPRGLFTVVNISNPAHPLRINTVYEEDHIRDFLTVDSLLYMSIFGGGVVIYNVQDPSTPVERVRFNEDRGFGRLMKYNNYLASSYGPVNIIDIQDPFDPEIVCDIDFGYSAYWYNIDFFGDYLLSIVERGHIPYFSVSFEIYNISDLSNPVQVFSDSLDSMLGWVGGQIKVIGNFAYLGGPFDGIRIYNINDPSNPQLTATMFENYVFSEFELRNNRLYAGTYSGELLTIDVTQPANPEITHEFYTRLYPYNMRESGDRLYFETGADAVSFLEISDPDSPVLDGKYVPGSFTWGVARFEDYAYLVDGNSGFKVVDVSDAENPVGVNYYYTSNQTHNVFVDDGLLFLADNEAGVLIFSLDDPLNPEYLSTVYTESNVNDMYATGNLLFIANTFDGFRIADITDPSDPQIIGGYSGNPSNYCGAIMAQGNYAYTAEEQDGLCVYDLSDINNPVKVTCYNEVGYISDLFISGNILFLSDYQNGLVTLDISNPSNPVFMDQAEFEQSCDLWADGNTIFVAARYSGIKAFDVTNAYAIQLIGSYNDDNFCTGIYAQNDTIYVAAGGGGLSILRYDESLGIEDISAKPDNILLSQNYPNPFNASTVIRYSIDMPLPVKISIYDLLGREVDSFDEGIMPAGRHDLIWKPGNRWPSGLYFCSIQAGNHEESRKMLFLK